MGATRAEALAVPCPQCMAPAGQLCTGRRGDRDSLHRERYTHAENEAAAAPAVREHRYYDDGPPVQRTRRERSSDELRRVAAEQEQIRQTLAGMKYRGIPR